MRRTFTPVQANKTLPLVKRIVTDILARGRELRALAQGPPGTLDGERVRRLEDQLREHMRELERIGCTYKDWGFQMGLVDFPGKIDGHDVFLCWRSDEPSVTWYHHVEAGFAGRRPIPKELLER